MTDLGLIQTPWSETPDKLEVVLHYRADTMVGHLVEVVIVEDAAVGGKVAKGAGRPLVLQPQIEMGQIVTNRRSNAIKTVEVGKVLASLHVDIVLWLDTVAKVIQIC